MKNDRSNSYLKFIIGNPIYGNLRCSQYHENTVGLSQSIMTHGLCSSGLGDYLDSIAIDTSNLLIMKFLVYLGNKFNLFS